MFEVEFEDHTASNSLDFDDFRGDATSPMSGVMENENDFENDVESQELQWHDMDYHKEEQRRLSRNELQHFQQQQQQLQHLQQHYQHNNNMFYDPTTEFDVRASPQVQQIL
jgi:hypothetical protein